MLAHGCLALRELAGKRLAQPLAAGSRSAVAEPVVSAPFPLMNYG